MVSKGFENVGQLHGGIATYGKDPETKGLYWDGKMYVFDERISVDVNQIDKTVIGKSILMVHLVNVILIVQTLNVINKFLFLKKMKKNI